MNKVTGRLIVYFEEPFWVGAFERISEGKLSVCKITFGAEPKDYEIYDFILKNYNPKRVQREVRKQVKNTGIGTRSQQALKLQQKKLKIERKTVKRERQEAEKERRFNLKQQKRKEKHRGR